jgi:hypothetical protein
LSHELSFVDVNPSSFLFRSSLPMSPRPPSDYFASKLPSTTTSSFDAYKSALRQRVTFRTPVLDSVLSELEDGAKSLQSDLQAAIKEGPSNSSVFSPHLRPLSQLTCLRTLIHEMRKQYSPAARACANSVIKELRDRLDPNTKNPVNGKAASHGEHLLFRENAVSHSVSRSRHGVSSPRATGKRGTQVGIVVVYP